MLPVNTTAMTHTHGSPWNIPAGWVHVSHPRQSISETFSPSDATPAMPISVRSPGHGGFVPTPARWAAQRWAHLQGSHPGTRGCSMAQPRPPWVQSQETRVDPTGCSPVRGFLTVLPNSCFSARKISTSCFPGPSHIWLFPETYGSDPPAVTPSRVVLEQTEYRGNLQPEAGESLSSVWNESIETLKKLQLINILN